MRFGYYYGICIWSKWILNPQFNLILFFRKQTENHFYTIASQIKLLLDMPEKVTVFV